MKYSVATFIEKIVFEKSYSAQLMRSIHGARSTGLHLTVDQYQRNGVLRMCHEVTPEGDFTCRFTHASGRSAVEGYVA